MKCKVLLILLFLVSVAQGQSTYFRFIDSTVSTSSTINLQNSGSIFHQISWTVSGTVATCTVAVDSSADGIAWSAGGIIPAKICTSNGDSLPQTHVVANFARINVTAISGAGAQVIVVYTAYTTAAAGGGTVTNVTASGPVTSSGGNTPNIACPTCAIGPGTSVAGHIATYSGTDGITLADGGAPGTGTVSNVATTSPIGGGPITTTGTLTCTTCTTNASALTSNSLVLGGGGQATKTVTGLTTDGTSTLNLGVAGTSGGAIILAGSASGTVTMNVATNASQLAISTITSLNLSGASGDFRASNAVSLTSSAGTTSVKGGQSNTINTAQVDFLPTNSNTGTSGTQVGTQARGTFAPTSGTSNFHALISNPTINQTGGANGTIRALASYPVNTALVGTEYLIAAGTSSATGPTGTLTDKFLVDSNGATTASGTITAPLYASTTNCAAVGTAASPSVVSCSAAPAGAFSCATNASAATCTINTTAVTANSEIIVQEVADEGTRLSVTCNTAPTVTPAILVATKTATTGFTINMPTITTNPACFDYWIIN